MTSYGLVNRGPGSGWCRSSELDSLSLSARHGDIYASKTWTAFTNICNVNFTNRNIYITRCFISKDDSREVEMSGPRSWNGYNIWNESKRSLSNKMINMQNIFYIYFQSIKPYSCKNYISYQAFRVFVYVRVWHFENILKTCFRESDARANVITQGRKILLTSHWVDCSSEVVDLRINK